MAPLDAPNPNLNPTTALPPTPSLTLILTLTLTLTLTKVEVAGLAHWQALAADDSTRSEVAAEAAEVAATEAEAGACAALPRGSPGALRKRAARCAPIARP